MMKLVVMMMIIMFMMMVVTDDAQDYDRSGGVALWIYDGSILCWMERQGQSTFQKRGLLGIRFKPCF